MLHAWWILSIWNVLRLGLIGHTPRARHAGHGAAHTPPSLNDPRICGIPPLAFEQHVQRQLRARTGSRLYSSETSTERHDECSERRPVWNTSASLFSYRSTHACKIALPEQHNYATCKREVIACRPASTPKDFSQSHLPCSPVLSTWTRLISGHPGCDLTTKTDDIPWIYSRLARPLHRLDSLCAESSYL